MNKDLTVGKPSSVLWKFCLPLFASIIFQQVYNIADSFIAGKFIGNDALAAVGNAYEITLLFIALAFGCNIGASVITAQLFGAKKYAEMKSGVSTALISTGTLCLITMIIGFVFCDGLLTLIKTPAGDVFDDSALYLRIYMAGLPFVFLYNVATGIFSALGDSKTPFIFLACSSVANVGADILFVTAFGMGVDGVAWATLICQGISCILSLFFLFRRLSAIQTEKFKLFSGATFKKFATVAIPSMLQQSFVSVGNIIIQGAVNSFGIPVMAGYSAAVKLNNLVTTSIMTVGNGISSFAAQNLGAKKHDRIKSGFWAGLKITFTLCIPIILLYFFFSSALVNLFLESNSDKALEAGVWFVKIVSPFYLLVALKLTADGILRGTGKMNAFMAGTFIDLAIRVILALTISKTSLGYVGIWLSWPIGWAVATVISVCLMAKSNYKKEI